MPIENIKISFYIYNIYYFLQSRDAYRLSLIMAKYFVDIINIIRNRAD